MVICDLYLRFGVIKTVMKTHQIKSVTLFVWGMLAIFWDTGDEKLQNNSYEIIWRCSISYEIRIRKFRHWAPNMFIVKHWWVLLLCHSDPYPDPSIFRHFICSATCRTSEWCLGMLSFGQCFSGALQSFGRFPEFVHEN